MKKRSDLTFFILFTTLMLVLFLPMLQQQFGIFKLEPLYGVVIETPKPELSYKDFKKNTYQVQLEKYVSENYGFREWSIRLYNQYLWDFYRKTFAAEVNVGKDRWLYYQQSVNDYYGTELYRWHNSTEDAIDAFDKEVKNMVKLRNVLKTYGIDFMMFMAPEKGFLYPEHLPDREKDTTTVNAREYFDEKLSACGFPYIEMTKWFEQMKDTCDYLLIPQTGAHWDYSCVRAADSLFRFMGNLKGIQLPKIKTGTLHKCSHKSKISNRDLEGSLNLIRKIRQNQPFAPEANVIIEADSMTANPKALFVGNSFLWRINSFIALDSIFDAPEFWYYYSTAYSAPNLSVSHSVSDLNLLEKLFDQDYIVFFTTGNQMYKACYGFVENALLEICVEDSVKNEVRNRLADSLKFDPKMIEKYKDKLQSDSTGYDWAIQGEASNLMKKDLEKYFPEIRDENYMNSRNSKIEKQLVIREIKRDKNWMLNINCQTVIKNIKLDQALSEEADNVLQNKPLLRDAKNLYQKKLYIESLVSRLKEELTEKPEMVESIKEKAEKNDISFEEALDRDARWIVNYKISQGIYVIPEENEVLLEFNLKEFKQTPQYDSLVILMIDQLRNNPYSLNQMKEKAQTKGITLEETLDGDARWIVDDKIRKGLIQIPDPEIRP